MSRRARRTVLFAVASVATLTTALFLHLNGSLRLTGSHGPTDPLGAPGEQAQLVPLPDTDLAHLPDLRPPPAPDLGSNGADEPTADVGLPVVDPIRVPDNPTPLPPPLPATPAPRMTLIVLWSPDDRTANYLPNFFASVGANPDVDILFIKFDKYHHGTDACEQVRAPSVPNVREMCLPLEEYYELHLEYLCSFWECSDVQRAEARKVMVKRFEGDRVNSSYRPFRGQVFKKFLHPDLTLWGWCDLDMMFGSLDRMFPYDVADQFDVIFSGAPTSNPKMQLFMPGHFTVFRHTESVARAFFALDEVTSYDNFMNMEWIIRPDSDGCEEGEYSHTLLMRSPLTFLRFDAIVDAPHHLSSLSGGVYGIENAGWATDSITGPADGPQPSTPEQAFMLPNVRAQINEALRERGAKSYGWRPTFSDKGIEAVVTVRDDEDISRDWFLWFPRRYAVLYMSSLISELEDDGRRSWRRYAMRRVPNGEVVERFEPDDLLMLDPLAPLDDWIYGSWNRPLLREALYNHFQTEKYARWWDLPDRPLKPDEILYIDREHGAHVWDGRENSVMWESARVE